MRLTHAIYNLRWRLAAVQNELASLAATIDTVATLAAKELPSAAAGDLDMDALLADYKADRP